MSEKITLSSGKVEENPKKRKPRRESPDPYSYKQGPVNVERALKNNSLDRKHLASHMNEVLKEEEQERGCMEDYEGIYSKEQIEKDHALVEEIKAEIKKKKEELSPDKRKKLRNSERIGKYFEITMQKLLDEYCCLGEELKTVPATEYDDYVNNTDTLIGTEETDYVLGVDFTTASGHDRASSKAERGLAKMAIKGSAAVRYNYSFNEDSVSGESRKVIPVVIGFDLKKCEILSYFFDEIKQKDSLIENIEKRDFRTKDEKEFWQNQKSEYIEEKREIANQMVSLPFYVILFEQIKLLLEKYTELGLGDEEIKKACSYFLERIEEVRSKKYDNSYVEGDKILSAIEERLDSVDKENLDYILKRWEKKKALR